MIRDQRWMSYALALGRRALGQTAENPPVGCAIVKDEQVVGVGCTQAGGRPHAEAVALAMAGDRARGATAYVTLEPCSHTGQTPPCAAALIAAGIGRVVAATQDPDERVCGQGFAMLRQAGVQVDIGIGADEARRSLRGFFMRKLNKRPYVTLKLGVSLDAKIAGRAGEPTQITGPETRSRVHLMRAQSDGIMVGLSTVVADNPDLTCRLPGLENRSPIRLVADSHLSISPQSRLVQTATEVPLWLLSTREGEVAPGITVIATPATAGGWVDFHAAFAELGGRGLNNLLVEGGSHIARSLVMADLVDSIYIFQSELVVGEEGLEAISRMKLSELDLIYRVVAKERLGMDNLTVYERER